MKNSNDSNEINIKFNSRSREIIFNLIPQKIFFFKIKSFLWTCSHSCTLFFKLKGKFFFHPKSLPPNDTVTRSYYTTSFKCSKDKNVLQFCHQYNQCNCKSIFNPLTLTSDQDGISPYNINTISSRQVTRIKKAINWRIVSWSNAKFSEPTS